MHRWIVLVEKEITVKIYKILCHNLFYQIIIILIIIKFNNNNLQVGVEDL